jgi:hypothetical protein
MEIALRSFGSMFSVGDSNDYYDLLFELSKNDCFVDRLFRRYVKREETNFTRDSLLKLSNGKLKKKLLEAFDYRVKTDEYLGKYSPIHITLTACPYRYLQIPLEDYDNLEGDPLWMRPEYMLEKYYPKEKQEKDKQTLEQMKKDHPDWF